MTRMNRLLTSTVLRHAFVSSNAATNTIGSTSSRFMTTVSQNLSPVQSKFVKLILESKDRNAGGILFSRYVKEMINAIDSNRDGMISEQELVLMMEQMGDTDSTSLLTSTDIKILFDELGEDVVNEKQIPTHSIEQLLLDNIQ